jgi:hypothetical protein
MNSTTSPKVQDVTISGRHYVAEGPTPTSFPAYILTSDAGTSYLATQAYDGDKTLLKVIGGRSFRELYIHGNRAMLRVTESGALVQEAW